MSAPIRKAAVAGSWYPASPQALAEEVDRHLGAVDEEPVALAPLVALVAPHAGLMYSGAVAASAYRLLRGRTFETVVLVGPSHFVGFEGVSVYRGLGFDTPLGLAEIDQESAAGLLDGSPVLRDHPAPHRREHSLEMHLPFLRRVAPQARIVPLLMGFQTAEVAFALGDVLASVLSGRRALLIASTDLSHYHDAATARELDAIVIDCVRRFDPEGLQRALDARHDHACGGGPTVAVMRAARLMGANVSAVLKYADSGDVSGDKSSVVGYLAAAFGSQSSIAEGSRRPGSERG